MKKFFLYIAVTMLTIFSTGTVLAQPPMPPDVPQDPQQTDVLFNNPGNYQIVYLVSEDTEFVNPLLAPDGLLVELTQASVIQTMDELREYDLNHSVDAVILHESAFAWIDIEWTGEVYRRGVAFATLNVPIAWLAEVQNSDCARSQAERFYNVFDAVGSDYFFLVSNYYAAASPEDQVIIEREYFGRCNTAFETTGLTWSKRRGTQGFLNIETDLYRLTNVIMVHVNGIREARGDFSRAQEGLPPLSYGQGE